MLSCYPMGKQKTGQNRSKTGQKQAKRRSDGTFNKGVTGNPNGRPKETEARGDGWESALGGLGVTGVDKREEFAHCTKHVTNDYARDLWRGNDLAATIIEKIPEDMVREGCRMVINDSEFTDKQNLQEDIEMFWSEIGLLTDLQKGLEFERAYGGGAIMIGAMDSGTMEEPLDPERVGEIGFLTVLEPREIQPHEFYVDPEQPKFGKPSTYQVTPIVKGHSREAKELPTTKLIHETRLIVFPGIVVSRHQDTVNYGFGDSILNRVHNVIRDFDIGWSAAALLLSDFSFPLYKMKGLALAIAKDGDKTLRNRLKALELARTVARTTIVDAEEDYERKTTNITGLPELLEQFKSRVSAAAKMPQTMLFGNSPGGLNATGESDIRMYYDRVNAMRKRKLIPAMKYVTRLWLLGRRTKIQVPEKWAIQCGSLWQPTQKEQAETNETQAKADAIYMDRGVVSADEIRTSRFGGAEFSVETQIDTKGRAEMRALERAPSVNPDPDLEEEAQEEPG